MMKEGVNLLEEAFDLLWPSQPYKPQSLVFSECFKLWLEETADNIEAIADRFDLEGDILQWLLENELPPQPDREVVAAINVLISYFEKDKEYSILEEFLKGRSHFV